jgi:UDP-glucose 4-epimerase
MIQAVMNDSKARSWGKLALFAFLVWVFGWIVGPYFENNIPIYKQIVHVVEERNIDSAGYMYKSSVGSYEGEYYLEDSFKHANRDDYGLTKAFFAGILSCFAILGMGWRYIMK